MIKRAQVSEDFVNGSMLSAQALGLSLNEAVVRGLIKRDAAQFLVQRSGELYSTLLNGGGLTQDDRGIYVEVQKPKETGDGENAQG